ncbi:MAG: right-handed parallel beta-helix repeat-containing protein, partial [Candidatus Margulisbacteria bacterium]|nr:right-handed parallel beta-helix repeat-containing protein [Candidatus Margulisiibacteriota bacterium]MBU1617808.1 right-handed parallel beta-helix repeat-containing protein [Candidatus Margulisiibacteriota bacterium]
YGGGICLRGMSATVSNNTIQNNECGKGGGLFIQLRDPTRSILVENNTITGNHGYSDHGGGVYIAAYKGKISNNSITNNSILEAYGWAGGMIIDGGQYSGFNDTIYLELSYNTYSGNFAPEAGSGLFIDEGANTRLYHELIYANTSNHATQSGGLYVDGAVGTANARTILENCTIADNVGGNGSTGHAIYIEGGSTVIAKNCIFWGNHSDNTTQFLVNGSSLTVTYSDPQGSYPGTGNINSNPLFVGGGDYHLQSGSPCRNTGQGEANMGVY